MKGGLLTGRGSVLTSAIVIKCVGSHDESFCSTKLADEKNHVFGKSIAESNFVIDDKIAADKLEKHIPEEFSLNKKIDSLLKIIVPKQRFAHKKVLVVKIIVGFKLPYKFGVVAKFFGQESIGTRSGSV